MTWTKAFARQAESDFETRDCLLRAGSLPQCHQLHYLQMALEKLAKAHLIAGGSSPEDLSSSHVYISKPIPMIVREMLARTPGQKDGWVVDAIRDLSRRIELLAPAVRDGGRAPANCEYPWKAPDGSIKAPADHDFGLDLVFEKAGVTMIKAARARARELASAT